ncbi:MAG: zinc-dependent alcohol dehydrogenase family protein [Rhodoplanes sp.]
MKVAVAEPLGFDHLKIIERPEPRPRAGEVLVRLRAASLNYRDLIAIEGGYGSQQKRSDLVPLSDGAGEIVELGEGVTRWRAGDRVVGCFFPGWQSGPPNAERLAVNLGASVDGVACEYRVFGEDAILRIPPHLDYAEAATLPCAALTAWVAVIEQHAINPSHAVLTQGTGGVALFALQFAALAGAAVIATSSTTDKLERLRALGARHLINYNDDATWGQTAFKLAGEGVDLVVDTGGAQTLSQSFRAVRVGGSVSVIGVVSGAKHALHIPILIAKYIRLQPVIVGNRDQFAAMLRAVEHHEVRPVIDRVFPFADLRAALQYLKSGRHFGKVCVAM